MDTPEIREVKKIFRLRLIYWSIIFILLAIFLLLISPRCVNPKAFEQFSFASTIVSIVLAVVSIVYSFRSKANSSDNFAGIKAIEESIDNKLFKLDSLGDRVSENVSSAISEGVENAMAELKLSVGNLLKEQAEIKNNLSRISDEQTKYFNSPTLSEETDSHPQTSFLGTIALYLAYLSVKHGKDINLSKIDKEFFDDYDYYWGFYAALNYSNKDSFSYTSIDKGVFHIDKIDGKKFGGINYLKKQIDSFSNRDLINKYLNCIDAYFENSNSDTQD